MFAFQEGQFSQNHTATPLLAPPPPLTQAKKLAGESQNHQQEKVNLENILAPSQN